MEPTCDFFRVWSGEGVAGWFSRSGEALEFLLWSLRMLGLWWFSSDSSSKSQSPRWWSPNYMERPHTGALDNSSSKPQASIEPPPLQSGKTTVTGVLGRAEIYPTVPFLKSWPTESIGVVSGFHFIPLNLKMACYTAKGNQIISLLGTDYVTSGKTVILFKEPFLQNSYLKIKSCFTWCCQDKMRQRTWTTWHRAQHGCEFPCEMRKRFSLSWQGPCIFHPVRHPPSHPPRNYTTQGRPFRPPSLSLAAADCLVGWEKL